MSLGHITGVGHTGITVSDIDRAIRFFRDALDVLAIEYGLAGRH